MDPTPETIDNRKAGSQLMTHAAMRGNKIALMTESLMLQASNTGFFVNTPVMVADEEDRWDDERPF